VAKLTKIGVLLVKRFFIIFVITWPFVLLPATLQADKRGFINTVVIDPGHGGRDPGAVGRNSLEKDIALSISLKLGNYIQENFDDVKVVYTRKTDEFVELFRRAQIANENHADLFISIHCNSTRGTAAYGTETFVMGLHRSEANLEVARKENASILYEDDYMETYGGFDPHSPEANIIFSLYQNAYLNQSLSIASFIQDQFRERAMRADRGVKQAGFLVLYQVTMPGILVETGFLSNPREEQYLMSETGQSHIASAIFRAFRDYKQQQDALAAARKYHDSSQTQGEPTNTFSPSPQTPVQTQDQQPQQPVSRRARARAQAQNQKLQQLQTQQAEAPDSEIQQTSRVSESLADSGTLSPSQSDPGPNPDNPRTPWIQFRVQIAVSSQKKELDAADFAGLPDVGYYFHEGLYKYTAGNLPRLEDAVELQMQLQQAGYKDAFVVAFSNNERITPAEAIRMMGLQSTNPQ
jgi:N-acetylmuramoyl-L-alanine amidase